MDAVQRWLTLLVLVSTALAAVLYVSRQIWRGFRLVERLADIVQHELTPNSGTSMKDDLAAIARAVGGLQADVADLSEAKQTAHDALQVQLDTIVAELGLGQESPGNHKRGTQA